MAQNDPALRAVTGLDCFEVRYMSSAHGRFTSPDAPFADQHPTDPHSWNLYAYGWNNPLTHFDPDGRQCEIIAGHRSAARYMPPANPRAAKPAERVGKVALGAGLTATVAVGDIPGGAMGAVLLANAVVGTVTQRYPG